LVTASNPIHPGDVITIYATGLGATSPEVPAGLPAPSTPPALAVLAPQVNLGDVSVNVGYAGLTPGTTGVYQITAQVPSRVPQGNQVPLTVVQAGITSSAPVRVVD